MLCKRPRVSDSALVVSCHDIALEIDTIFFLFFLFLIELFLGSLIATILIDVEFTIISGSGSGESDGDTIRVFTVSSSPAYKSII